MEVLCSFRIESIVANLLSTNFTGICFLMTVLVRETLKYDINPTKELHCSNFSWEIWYHTISGSDHQLDLVTLYPYSDVDDSPKHATGLDIFTQKPISCVN